MVFFCRVSHWLTCFLLFLPIGFAVPVSAQGNDLMTWREARTMPALVGHLEDWLDAQSDYPRRADAPLIRWIDAGSARALTGILSSAHDTNPRGFYDADARTIWLINPWSHRDPFDVSVLLHELAHHRQAAAGHWYCPGAQELPAYRLQKAWLAALGLELYVNWIAIVLESGCTARDIHPD